MAVAQSVPGLRASAAYRSPIARDASSGGKVTQALLDPAGILDRAPELADLAHRDAAIARAVARGDSHAVYRALWWARLRGRLAEHRPTIDALLAHRALFVSPIRRTPVLSTVNGMGATVYGSSSKDPDGSYIKTHFLVFAFAPLFPLAQYLVRDAERGWYFLGKVPMSTPIRIWNRLVVLGIFAAVAAGAFQTFHSWRYHDVHVVNGLPWPVHVAVGDVQDDVPARQRRTVSVSTGQHPVRVTSASGAPVESGDLLVEAGTDVLVWNVLGAAPLFERTVVYETAKGATAEPEPQLFCGERSIRRGNIDYAFAEPPQTISMPEGQSVAYRHQLAVLNQDVDFCANMLAGKPEAALVLAKGLATLDPDGSRTPLAAGLCRAVGRNEEALRLAERALAQHPDSVEHHRLYQSIAKDEGRGSELVTTYKARFEASPGSPDAAYLYARMLPDAEGLALAATFVEKFPDHVGLRRIMIYRQMRERRFAEALASLERLRAVDREGWAESYLDDQLTALAGVGRVVEAKTLAEEAFARKEGSPLHLAAIHAWLSGGSGPAAETLLTKLAEGDPRERLELQVRFWTAPADASLAPLAAQPDQGLYRLMQHAHYDPRAAIADVLTARPEDLRRLDLQVQILLLAEAHRAGATAAWQRLEPVVERYVPPSSVRAYLDDGTWDEAVEELPLAAHAALHLARSRKPGLSPQQRADLRALAERSDPVGGYVRMALAGWPPA
jgi:tetratricopeptide (TPR) repeat protein